MKKPKISWLNKMNYLTWAVVVIALVMAGFGVVGLYSFVNAK